MDFFADPIGILNQIPSSDPFSAMFFMISQGGWIIFVIVIIWGLGMGYLRFIRDRFDDAIEFVLLAIDIPKGNEQSPKAVENIFSHLFAILKHGNAKERYIKGYTQMGFSFEIVSIEGYIQFLIRSPLKFRDLVEAAIYAQYPEAEITEVEDYVDLIPRPLEYPHEEWDFWGSQIKLMKPSPYPIRTYPLFEHGLSQTLMDPMASLLEIMSRMGPGEQLWLQLLIAPVKSDWREAGMKIINKLISKKDTNKSGVDWSYFPREIGKGLQESFTASLITATGMENAKNKQGEKEWPSMMQHLSPPERDIIESVGQKISKLGFQTKIRFIYSAKKNIFNKPKGVDGFKGAIYQFNTQNLNGFEIDKKTRTKIDYFFIKSRVLGRKRRILWAYRNRSMTRGRAPFILNTEELATVWHFPMSETVKVPSLQTVGAKKGSAPVGTPYQSENTINKNEPQVQAPSVSKPSSRETKKSPPPNLPFS